MDVREAVMTRRSVRGFPDTPVSRRTLEQVLEAACRAPSGGNLQPWRLYTLTSDSLDQLKDSTAQRIATGSPPDEPEYTIYPPDLTAPYRDRRFHCGEQLYSAIGVPREDKQGRRRQFARNYQLFGAPVGLFCTVLP
ncbi:nitroreductase family protein [Streptomyces canus]|uniref:nitroreductase family protein n=1 Tax=Streptomyces canus TaxID=58343 RepID=UPI002E34C50A|nr:nitroreductase family protein [Streptomyces canus]